MPISGPGLPRSYLLGQYALELDGVAAGWLLSADGGYAYADVISALSGSGTVVRKHLGKVKYEEITVTAGLGMSRAFYDWLKGVSDRTPVRKNGAIVLVDFKGNEVSRLEFVNALITEINFPACDGASKDPASFTVKWRPESTRYLKGAKAWGGLPALPKPWSVANFRLLLDGLDCTRVKQNRRPVAAAGTVRNRGGPVARLGTDADLSRYFRCCHHFRGHPSRRFLQLV